jgi:hypothetical protein
MHFLEVMARIRDACIVSTDLLKEPYRSQVESGAHPLTGHCYVACEALYHILKPRAGFTPMTVEMPDGGTHWFLRGPFDLPIDPTMEQFVGKTFPNHREGRGRGFLTKEPSARAKKILERAGLRPSTE